MFHTWMVRPISNLTGHVVDVVIMDMQSVLCDPHIGGGI